MGNVFACSLNKRVLKNSPLVVSRALEVIFTISILGFFLLQKISDLNKFVLIFLFGFSNFQRALAIGGKTFKLLRSSTIIAIDCVDHWNLNYCFLNSLILQNLRFYLGSPPIKLTPLG